MTDNPYEPPKKVADSSSTSLVRDLMSRFLILVGVLAWFVTFLAGVAFISLAIGWLVGQAGSSAVLSALTIFALLLAVSLIIEFLARISSRDEVTEEKSDRGESEVGEVTLVDGARSQPSIGTEADNETRSGRWRRRLINCALIIVFGPGTVSMVVEMVNDPDERTPTKIGFALVLGIFCLLAARDLWKK